MGAEEKGNEGETKKVEAVIMNTCNFNGSQNVQVQIQIEMHIQTEIQIQIEFNIQIQIQIPIYKG